MDGSDLRSGCILLLMAHKYDKRATHNLLHPELLQHIFSFLRSFLWIWSPVAKGKNVLVSEDGRMASADGSGWVRSTTGVEEGTTASWGLKLSKENGGNVFFLGMVSELFTEFSRDPGCFQKEVWFFQNDAVWCAGEQIGTYKAIFRDEEIIEILVDRTTTTMSLKVDGVLRKEVTGKIPAKGILYPAVGILNKFQTVTFM